VIKPTLFIGSSSEGLKVARLARQALESAVEVSVWDEGAFPLGQTFIEALVNALRRFDFALMVMTPDDPTQSRGTELFGARDNVIFELGLFTGSLGRERTFVLHELGIPLKIPSDLLGVSMATYRPRNDGDLRAAVSSGCDAIRESIEKLGFSDKKVTQVIGDMRERQREQTTQISRQAEQIRALEFALRGIVTQYEVEKLIGLDRTQPFLCYYSDDLYSELRRLRALGFVQNNEGVGLRNIRDGYKDKPSQFDLKHYFSITPEGHEYLKLREAMLKEADLEF